MKILITTTLTAAALLTTTVWTRATPYASGLTNNGGTVSFFLNESADNVRVILNNGAGGTNNLGALARGKYSFSLGANTTYSIVVTKASGAGYKSSNGSGGAVKLQISESTNRFLNFENPRGIRVNRNPSSRFFGRIYTANTRTNFTSSNLSRPMGVGIYMINPDQTSAHPPGQEDSPLRPANWPLALNTSSSGNTFPYGLTIGPDDSLYAADWTDSSGNLWMTDADAADPGSAVLKLLSAVGTALVPVGVNNTHGSINAAHLEGSVAAGTLVAWTIDEDLQTDKATTTKTELNSLWRYDVLNNGVPYQPDGVKVWTASGKQGISTSEQTCDMVRGSNGNFYITMQRSAGNESGLAIVSGTGTPLWNSWDASQLIRAGTDLITNLVRVALSHDEKFIAVARSTGLVWIMPLINGLPDLTNRLVLQPFGASSSLRGLSFDAANNLYVDNSSTELLGIFSPGGTTVATTSNNASGTAGGFNVTVPATSVSVSASVSSITEAGGTNGVFTITRSGDNSSAITIPYTISGTASNTADFTTGPGTVTLAAFQNSTNILVTPINDSEAELTETVILTLQGGAGYSVGSPGSATVSILDDEAPQISFQPSAQQKLLESYAPSRVTYQVTRRGLLTPALTVNLAYSGSATYGADFSGPATVALGANIVNASVTLSPINDQLYEGDETAVITVAPGPGYQPASAPANSITALIIDDEFPHGQVLFSDDFETNSAPLWTVNLADPSDAFVDFAYNYSAVGIPPAPGGGGTKGLRMRCGNTRLQIDGLSVSPATGNFPDNYRLKFDMWIDYNGPMPDGGPGSTQHFDAGVGTDGTRVEWYNNPDADGVWFTASGDGADGNVFGDYSAFIGSNNQNDDTGFYAAGTGGPNSGVRNSSHPFYSLWGGQAAPAAQLALYPNQSGVANIGNAGMAWHTVVITKVTNIVTWAMDGITLATVTNDSLPFANNVFVGYQDRFSSGTISDNPELSFGLVDNLRVETYVPAPLIITAFALVTANVEVTFTGPPASSPASFKLQSSALVNGTYADDNSAIITQLSPGLFKATTPRGTGPRFYRIKQ